MTKGRTENNRAWEKERRDRLNRSFDILAKFLPNYDENVAYSKIEIIQKSILLIKDLQHKLKELLAENHKDILNTILELEEAFKVLILRNKVLTALLKQCGGTAPPFTEPKIFNYIVTSPLDESDLNELYIKHGRPPKNENARKKKKLQTLHDDETMLQKKKKNKSNKKDEKKKNEQLELKNDAVSDAGNISATELKDESTKPKDSNDKINDQPSSAIPSVNSGSKAAEIKQNVLSTPIVATGILLPISNLKKSLNLDSGPIIVVNALPKASTIMPKPVIKKKVPGKIAIVPLKSKVVPRKQRIRRTKKEIEQDRKSSKESKLPTLKKNAVNSVSDSDVNKCDKSQTEQKVITDVALKESDLSKAEDTQPDTGRIETTEPTLPQPELSNEILASLQIPQNDSNNESMSPTAAFLMSFPVVSSAGVRIGEDEQEAHDLQSMQQPESSNKPANETNILDNISNLLTTKDYEKFVEDAVKHDVANCQENVKTAKDSDVENGQEKRRAAVSFDFQLKPIMNSCAEVKTGIQTCPKTSVTSSSTYLPEVGHLSYKTSPTKKHRKSTNEENISNATNISISQDNLLSLTTPTRTSTDDYIRNQAALDFITSSSTVLHNIEPPTKMLKLSDTDDPVKKTEGTSFDNQFLRNSSVCTYPSNSVTPSNTYSTTYNYDKLAATVAKSDSRTSAKENVDHFGATSSVLPTVSRAISIDSSLPKSSKASEKQKESLNFLQPFVIKTTETTGTTTSIICSENQLNSFYTYPNSTITYSSTTIPHLSTSVDRPSSNLKTFEESTAKTTASSSIDKTFFKTNHSTSSSTTDGFYTSLTSIGTTHSNIPQYPSSIMRPNMYTSALSLSSSSNQKALDYAPQTPFTFSLTTPLNTISNAKGTTLTSCQQSQNYLSTTHSASYAQDYNPFAFENISSISTPITPYSACRETSQFSFSLTSTTNKVTSRNASQNSFSIDHNFLTDTRLKPITPMKSDLEKKVNYKHCPKEEIRSEEMKNKSTHKIEKSVTKQHVNWMTSTTDLQKNEYSLIPALDYTQPVSLSNHYLSQPTSQLSNLNSQKNTDVYFGHSIGEDFQWSPNKMIDTPNINSTTLPNLHGDLALNSITPKPQISSQDKGKNSKLMLSSHVQPQQTVTSNPTNSYFSVSQLVDHPKSVGQSKPYEDSVLQSKTSKASTNHSRLKHKDSKKVVKPSSSVSNFTPNIFVESFAYNEPLKQNNSNNYSAEALISIHPSKKEHKSISNYANQSEYCNQLETYNNMDYLNESNYNYYNNSYFPQIPDNEYFCGGSYSDQQFHNKSSRTSVPSTKLTTIGDTSYGSHTSQNNLYTFPHPSGKLCQQSSQYKSSSQLSTSYNQSRPYVNTNKKQFKQDLFPSSYDPNSSTNYFPPSLNINTPMLPHPPLIPTPHNIPSNDDFNYTTHLNYPTSLSKTSTYPTSQISENQGNLMLHGNIGGNVGNLVTNFNLSTICPEINDKTRQQNW